MAKNINRDYKIYISLLEAPTKGKITTPKDIVFYNTDRHTQNIYLVIDMDVRDLSFILAFRNEKTYKVAGQMVANNIVEFEIPYEYLQVAGRYEAQVVMTVGDDRMNSEPFTFTVKNSITRR